ncbi:MAG TPA: plastocyanin/azurin family copper-binding protein [Gemmatimonadales bacterium]|nr:plastocyanin/azurin family copper-binding protein [Gemmatimonadales bacterium]
MLRAIPPRLPLLLTAVLLGCGGDGGGDNGGTPPTTTAIAKASASGDAQTGVVAQPLANPIQVVVTDGGTPAAGVTVAWSTSVPGATLAATSVTDAGGLASNSWTLGTVAGSQSAQASLSGASGSPVSFTATAAPAAASELEKVSGDGQQAAVGTALANPLVAKVSDQFGNGVAGVDVAWAASDGSLSAPTVASGPNGTSAVNLTMGDTEGPITITATAGTLAGSPQTFTATATAAPPPSSDITVRNDFFDPGTLTVSAGTTVTWTWAAGATSHNVTPVASQPTGSGTSAAPHSYQFTFNTPGTYNYYCTLHGSPTFGMRGIVVVQ